MPYSLLASPMLLRSSAAREKSVGAAVMRTLGAIRGLVFNGVVAATMWFLEFGFLRPLSMVTNERGGPRHGNLIEF